MKHVIDAFEIEQNRRAALGTAQDRMKQQTGIDAILRRAKPRPSPTRKPSVVRAAVLAGLVMVFGLALGAALEAAWTARIAAELAE